MLPRSLRHRLLLGACSPSRPAPPFFLPACSPNAGCTGAGYAGGAQQADCGRAAAGEGRLLAAGANVLAPVHALLPCCGWRRRGFVHARLRRTCCGWRGGGSYSGLAAGQPIAQRPPALHLQSVPPCLTCSTMCPQHSLPFPEQLDGFLENMLRSRISRRVMAEQHINLTHQRPGYIGEGLRARTGHTARAHTHAHALVHKAHRHSSKAQIACRPAAVAGPRLLSPCINAGDGACLAGLQMHCSAACMLQAAPLALCALAMVLARPAPSNLTRAPLHLAPWHAAGIVCTHLNLADAVDFAATRCKQVGGGCSLLAAACLRSGRA